MRIADLWHGNAKPTVSFELFPAKSEKGKEKLRKVIDRLALLEPDFVSVTFGAGGSTREGSYELTSSLIKDKRLTVLPYFAGYGLGPDEIAATVGAYIDLGIESLLAVRGDPPEDLEGFTPHADAPPHASDLIDFLGRRFDLCLGAAGYPEGHVAATSKESDLQYLKLKVDRGAAFIIANYCYDNLHYFDFVERARAAGIEVPIVPGVMPIYNLKMMESLAALCGATITDALRKGIAVLPEGDQEALGDFGISLATAQCRSLLKNGAPGIHLYTMDRAKSAVAIVENLLRDGLI